MILSNDLSHAFNSCSCAIIAYEFLGSKLKNKYINIAACRDCWGAGMLKGTECWKQYLFNKNDILLCTEQDNCL
jgi:hypothetical protein